MLLYLSCLVLAVTLFFCIFSLFDDCYYGVCKKFSLKRCLASVTISILVATWGLRKKSLNWSGAVAGIFVGFIHTYSSYCFLSCLFIFFYTSSKATHFGSSRKKKFEAEFKEGGQRNWIQVICNGGASTEMAMLFFLLGGPGEVLIDFDKYYLRSWLSAAVIAALAGSNGDTWASEIGTVVAKENPMLITSLQTVPIGTNGGFTTTGLCFSALGGAAVGTGYFLVLLYSSESSRLTSQAFLCVFIGAFSGLFGSLLDSFVGATLQYSGIDVKTGKIVEKPGSHVKHISGRPVFDNHSVNMIMTILTCIAAPSITALLLKVI